LRELKYSSRPTTYGTSINCTQEASDGGSGVSTKDVTAYYLITANQSPNFSRSSTVVLFRPNTDLDSLGTHMYTLPVCTSHSVMRGDPNFETHIVYSVKVHPKQVPTYIHNEEMLENEKFYGR
jgi:hypothetical protein